MHHLRPHLVTVCTDKDRTFFSVKRLLPHSNQTPSSPSFPPLQFCALAKEKGKEDLESLELLLKVNRLAIAEGDLRCT